MRARSWPWLAGAASLVALACVPARDGVLGAARETLVLGASASLLGGAIGALVSLVSAALGGETEAAVQRTTEIVGALPTVLLAPILAASIPHHPRAALALAIALGRATVTAETLRTTRQSIEREGFGIAAAALGATRFEILRRHVLPFSLAPLASTLAAGAATAVGLEVAIAFLGLSPAPAGLGALAAAAFASGDHTMLVQATIGAASLAAVLLFAASALRDRLDPRSSARRS